jgi:hypothetical protein
VEHKKNITPPKSERFDPRLISEAARLAAALGFEPVPVRARRDGWTVERQLVYLAVLASGGSPREAAERVEMTPQGAGKLLRRPDASAFAAACSAAFRIGEPERRSRAAARRAGAHASRKSRESFPPPGKPNFRNL